MKTALIHSDAYQRFDYGASHPLRMERLGLTYALMDAYGLLAPPETRVTPPRPAPEAVLGTFHTAEYLEVLRAASAGQEVPVAYRYGLGPGDHPIWAGMYEARALASGVRGGGPSLWREVATPRSPTGPPGSDTSATRCSGTRRSGPAGIAWWSPPA